MTAPVDSETSDDDRENYPIHLEAGNRYLVLDTYEDGDDSGYSQDDYNSDENDSGVTVADLEKMRQLKKNKELGHHRGMV